LRLFWRIHSACCCILCIATTLVWVRAREMRDLFLRADAAGTVVGVATSPGECVVFRHIDPNQNGQRLQVGLGFSHHSFVIPNPDISDRYLVPTHSFSGGAGSSAGRGGRGAAPIARPTFTPHWAGPGIRAQGGTFNGINFEQIVVSFWLITCALAIGPTISGVRLVAQIWCREYRRRHRRCILCGFDLRASTDRCPECGHPIPAKPQPPATAPARTDTPA
jgi:hypothetical protein